MTAEQFTTMLLRELNYTDGDHSDFAWEKSLDKALDIQLLTLDQKNDIEKDSTFTRGEMSILAYNFLKIKEGTKLR